MSGFLLLRHGRDCGDQCDYCYDREKARLNPPRCGCCGELHDDRHDEGEPCDDCKAAECGERNVGSPCFVTGKVSV